MQWYFAFIAIFVCLMDFCINRLYPEDCQYKKWVPSLEKKKRSDVLRHLNTLSFTVPCLFLFIH